MQTRKLIIFTSYATLFMLGIYITFYQYTVLSISGLFLLNAAVMGIIIGIQHAGMILPPLFLGVLSGKAGKKRVVLIAFLLLISGTSLAGLANELWVYISALFIIGAGFSVAEATFCAVLADEFPEKSSRHLNFSQMAFSTGTLTGPFLAKFLIESGVYFKDLYFYCSGAFLLLGIVFMFTKHKNDLPVITENLSISGHFSTFFKSAPLIFLGVGLFLYVGTENTVPSFTDSYFEVTLGSAHLSATALALFWGAMIPSRFLAGIFSLKRKRAFVSLSVILIISLISAMLVDNNIIKIILFALAGFACGPMFPYFMDAAARKTPGSSGPIMNIMFSFAAAGGAITPFVAGFLGDTISFTAVYILCAVIALAMLATYLVSNRQGG